MNNSDEYVVRKMNVKLKKEEYQKLINGEIHSDNGLRNKDGKLSSLPDIEDIPDEDEDYSSSNYSGSYEEDSGDAIVELIISGLIIGIAILSDEEKRKAIKNWWTNKVVPMVKNTTSTISRKAGKSTKAVKAFVSSKNKKEKQLVKKDVKTAEIVDMSADLASTEKQKKNTEEFKKFISGEEAQQQIQDIKNLATLLAGKIKEFSESYVREDLTPEEQIEQQTIIKELTSKEVKNSMQMLIENKNFMLEESTSRIFSDFLSGNIIVNGKVISIEKLE